MQRGDSFVNLSSTPGQINFLGKQAPEAFEFCIDKLVGYNPSADIEGHPLPSDEHCRQDPVYGIQLFCNERLTSFQLSWREMRQGEPLTVTRSMQNAISSAEENAMVAMQQAVEGLTPPQPESEAAEKQACVIRIIMAQLEKLTSGLPDKSQSSHGLQSVPMLA